MHLFYTPDIDTTLELPEEEVAHAVRVLRLKADDEVMLTDGTGRFFHAAIDAVSGKHCQVRIVDIVTPQRQWRGHLTLAFAPTKNMDRVEWMVEKATEIGIDTFALLECRYSERRVVKTERLEKIVVAAMKQSLKPWKPAVTEMTPFEQFVRQPFQGQRFIAHCYSEQELAAGAENEADRSLSYRETDFRCDLQSALDRDGNVLVMVGPEGDFSIDEVRLALSLGFRSVSLGRSRLRTETAALVAAHLMNLAHTY